MRLQRVSGKRRLVLRLDAGDGVARLSVQGQLLALRAGLQEVSVEVSPGVGVVALAGDATIEAFACVSSREDIAPPPPGPWKADAGTAEP